MVGAGMTLQHSISTSDYNHNDPSNSHIKDMSLYDQLNHLLSKYMCNLYSYVFCFVVSFRI